VTSAISCAVFYERATVNHQLDSFVVTGEYSILVSFEVATRNLEASFFQTYTGAVAVPDLCAKKRQVLDANPIAAHNEGPLPFGTRPIGNQTWLPANSADDEIALRPNRSFPPVIPSRHFHYVAI